MGGSSDSILGLIGLIELFFAIWHAQPTQMIDPPQSIEDITIDSIFIVIKNIKIDFNLWVKD
jgi:hypothetical protein